MGQIIKLGSKEKGFGRFRKRSAQSLCACFLCVGCEQRIAPPDALMVYGVGAFGILLKGLYAPAWMIQVAQIATVDYELSLTTIASSLIPRPSLHSCR